MLRDLDFVFIIGVPRSGTTWLQAMVAVHSSVCSTIDELKLFDFFTVPLEDGWRYLLRLQKDTGGDRNGLTAIWTDDEFYGFLRDFVNRVYTQVWAMKPRRCKFVDGSRSRMGQAVGTPKNRDRRVDLEIVRFGSPKSPAVWRPLFGTPVRRSLNEWDPGAARRI